MQTSKFWILKFFAFFFNLFKVSVEAGLYRKIDRLLFTDKDLL